MATVLLSEHHLRVVLHPLARAAGLLRDLEVPLDAVTAVSVVPDGQAAVRGLRAPGLGLPGFRSVGTWRGQGRTYVDVRRGRPALDVRLRGQRWARLLVSVESPEATAARLRAAAGLTGATA